MKMVALTPSHYNRLRGMLRTYIKKAVQYSDLTVMGVESDIRNGQIIPVMFTEAHAIYNAPTPCGLMTLELDKNCLHVTTIAGKLPKDWKPQVFATLTDIAKGQGRRRIELKGRKGWARLLKPWGFKLVNDDRLRVEL